MASSVAERLTGCLSSWGSLGSQGETESQTGQAELLRSQVAAGPPSSPFPSHGAGRNVVVSPRPPRDR